MASPARRGDTRLLLIVGATLGVVVVGLVIAGLILVVTGSGGPPRRYEPFGAGYAKDLRKSVREGGPVLFADPFGGNRSMWISPEGDSVVALWILKPGTKDCNIKWRGTLDSFVDCEGRKIRSRNMARFATRVPTRGDDRGVLLVDLRQVIPPPDGPPRR